MLSIFLLEHKNSSVYYCRTAAFGTEPRGYTPATSPLQTFPPNVQAGDSLQFDLAATPEGPGEYNLVTGPDGLEVSPEGLVAWTPSREQVGSHQVKIRHKTDTGTSFLRYSVQVHRAPGDEPAEPEFRTWSDSTGQFSVAAMMVGVEGDKVRLKKRNGEVIEVPLSRLSYEDKAVVEAIRESGD